MKKISSIILVHLFVISFLQAQIKTTQPAKILKSSPATTKTIPPPPPPPANTAPAQIASVYTLTAATVTIKTGSDNKEFPSTLVLWLLSRGSGYALEQPATNLRNELKVNSTNDFGLQQSGLCDAKSRTLEAFQKQGLLLRIRYLPNFPTDAWKIDAVSITLEFKDQFGNPHPTLGHKTIIFNNANGFLDAWNRDMECTADASFNPLTSSIKQ
jgi:hypothetical protein